MIVTILSAREYRGGAVACLMVAEAAMPVGWVGRVSPFPGNSDHRKIKKAAIR